MSIVNEIFRENEEIKLTPFLIHIARPILLWGERTLAKPKLSRSAGWEIAEISVLPGLTPSSSPGVKSRF